MIAGLLALIPGTRGLLLWAGLALAAVFAWGYVTHLVDQRDLARTQLATAKTDQERLSAAFDDYSRQFEQMQRDYAAARTQAVAATQSAAARNRRREQALTEILNAQAPNDLVGPRVRAVLDGVRAERSAAPAADSQ